MRRVLAASAALAVAATLSALPSSQAAATAPTAAPPKVHVSAGAEGEGWGITSSHARFQLVAESLTPPASYDVRVSRASMLSPHAGAWKRPSYLQRITRTKLRFPIAPGQVVCISARARDAAGNVGPWRAGEHLCLVRALHANKLHRSGPVTTVRRSGYYNGTGRIMHVGSKLTLYGVPKGASIEMVYAQMKGRETSWKYPGWTMPGHNSDITLAGTRTRSWLWCINRFSRKGALVFGAWRESGNKRSEPLQGVAIYPQWIR